jgi:hypothetical protein
MTCINYLHSHVLRPVVRSVCSLTASVYVLFLAVVYIAVLEDSISPSVKVV